ncbi:MAG TPA: 3-deoxy-manno-octulosonate cytidylyltransferase [Bacteroidales bacterium]|nr:3-deoxy-manno-octulosonate cytidylyltransferase [Bacteroidales bacterium]
MTRFLGIIPARYASTRFPGKPLALVNGKPMIERVYQQAMRVFENVYVATDDERIVSAVENFGGKVIMTSPSHPSGTDRICEALDKIEKQEDKTYDVVFNVQGDEPYIQAEALNQLKECFNEASTHIATLAKPIHSTEDVFNPNHVKLVRDASGKALYFSRSPIPYLRNIPQEQWAEKHTYLKHLGIYAYRTEVLRKVTKLHPSTLEIAESLEQNRWLENGFTIRVEITEYESISIDTPEDLERVNKMKL